jgi:hypothetical protein
MNDVPDNKNDKDHLQPPKLINLLSESSSSSSMTLSSQSMVPKEEKQPTKNIQLVSNSNCLEEEWKERLAMF